MEVEKVKVSATHGIHLRNAARIVEAAKKFKSKIYLCHKCMLADYCSILEILMLAIARDGKLALIA